MSRSGAAKLALVLFAVLAEACGGSRAPMPAPAETRVMLLGVSGADPDIVRGLAEEGELPTIRKLIAEGAFGPLHSISPLLPAITWTTVATGRNPASHGITDYLAMDPESGRLRPVASWLRRREAVWDILGSHGLTVGVVGWPVTRPAERVRGTLVPPSPPSAAGGRWGRFQAEIVAADRMRREALRIWREEQPRFLALHVGLLDPICHDFMPFAPPLRPEVSEADHLKFGEGLVRAHRYLDDLVGTLLAAADENTVLLLVSEHGLKHGPQRPVTPIVRGHRSEIRWHRPYGFFLAHGKGVRRGQRLRGATVHDVTPTVMGLFGLPRAEDLPGEFLGGAFRTAPPGDSVATFETDRPSRNVRAVFGAGAEEGWNPLGLAPLEWPGRSLTIAHPMVFGAYLAQQGKFEKAERQFREVLGFRPDSARAHFQLAWCLQKTEDPRGAREHYRRAAWLDPDFTAAHLRLAGLLEEAGYRAEAIRRVRLATKAEPANPVAHCRLAQLLVKAGRLPEAEKRLRHSLVLEPRFPAARNQLGILLISRGSWDEAERHLRAATDLDPTFVQAWNNLGVTVLRRAAGTAEPAARAAALARAGETLDEVIDRFPEYPKAYYNRARLNLVLSRREQALSDVRRALDLDPDYEEARKLLKALDGP